MSGFATCLPENWNTNKPEVREFDGSTIAWWENGGQRRDGMGGKEAGLRSSLRGSGQAGQASRPLNELRASRTPRRQQPQHAVGRQKEKERIWRPAPCERLRDQSPANFTFAIREACRWVSCRCPCRRRQARNTAPSPGRSRSHACRWNLVSWVLLRKYRSWPSG